MEKIINKLINESTKGVDIYNHNGSTWLIFTESKQWVIELTESKTLWYNFNFFKNLFGYVSLEVVQNQHLITKWVEDNVINAVKHTQTNSNRNILKVEDTLQNGVKTTYAYPDTSKVGVNDTIQNVVNDTIQNGVKETKMSPTYTEYGDWLDGDERLDNIIQNGIKETQFNWCENKSWVEGVIKGGVKETLNTEYMPQIFVDNTIKTGVKETRLEQNITEGEIDDIIQDGVKEVHPLPAQDWNGDWGKYYHGKEDRTKPFNEYLNDTLEMGVKIK